MKYSEIVVRGKPVIPKLLDKSANMALVVAGGSSQGIRTGGALCGLETLGFSKSFAAAYGTSSGATNIAYFLAEQTQLGISIYYQDIINNNYASLARWPFIDINYLIDEIVGNKKRLNTENIKNSPTKFRIPVTNKYGKGIFLSVEKDLPTLEALRLGISIGFYAGDGEEWNGERYYDGMMSEPIPFRKAIEDGYKNILVLLNMPFDWNDKKDNLFLKMIKYPWLRNKYPKFRQVYLCRQGKYKKQLLDLCKGKIPNNVNITIVAPSPKCSSIPFYTRNITLIRRCIKEGISITEELFNTKLSFKLL